MSRELELLALRKQVLVARAGLQRYRLASDATALREALRWPRAAAALAASAPARSALAGLLLFAARRWRALRVLRIAVGVLAVARVGLSLWARSGASASRTAPAHAPAAQATAKPPPTPTPAPGPTHPP